MRGQVAVGLLFMSFAAMADSMVLIPVPVSSPAPPPDRDRTGVRWGATPVFNYNSDRGVQIGGFAQRFDYSNPTVLPYRSLLTVEATYATEGERQLIIARERTGLGEDGRGRLNWELAGSRNPYYPFYGIGNRTEIDAATSAAGGYEFEAVEVAGGIDYRRPIGNASDGRPDWNIVAGVSQLRLKFAGADRTSTPLSLSLVLDRRDAELTTSSGDFTVFNFSAAPGFLETGGPSWARTSVDHRRYYPLIARRWLWYAVQGRATWVSPGAPVTRLARLGSVSTVRGLPFNRYLDSFSASVRNELRSIWFRSRLFDMPLKFGTSVFTDIGWIASHPGRIASAPTRAAWGFGFLGSYFTDDFLGSAEMGFSAGSTSVYLHLGHTF